MCIKKNNKKEKKSGVSSLRRWNKNWLLVLLAIASKFGLHAKEIYNAKIVETFGEVIGQTGFHYAGVDINGDGLVDLFINVPYVGSEHSSFFTRLAGLLKEGATVSLDDGNVFFSARQRSNAMGMGGLLEINGRSVLQIFPGLEVNFPTEAARQERLKRENAKPAPAPAPSNDALTPEEQRLLLELLRRQQGNQ